MSTKRWMFAIVSFVAAIGVSLYIVISSWPRQHAAVSMDLGPHLMLLSTLVLIPILYRLDRAPKALADDYR